MVMNKNIKRRRRRRRRRKNNKDVDAHGTTAASSIEG
jgi:hypothetical protein